MKKQILFAIALFGGIYHVATMASLGVNLLSITWVIIGTGYIVSGYKDSTFELKRDVEISKYYQNLENSRQNIDKL